MRDSAASGINSESGDDEHFAHEATVTATASAEKFRHRLRNCERDMTETVRVGHGVETIAPARTFWESWFRLTMVNGMEWRPVGRHVWSEMASECGTLPLG